MKGCKLKYIIKINYAVSVSKDNGKENHKRAKAKFEFEKQLIERYSGFTLDYIMENYTNFRRTIHNLEPLVYNGKYWLSYMDVGLEMISDKFGITFEHHYDKLYMGIPLVETELINYIESIQPDWFTTVSKI